ncbi:TetR/AcrR family transcriptional regulator [Actinocrispum wychmicini]|uniref:TetR/AcrR family transcriptional regulator n=1 Tax=Actinocrispum wychmicini TaxID=1213861 RepID=UPI001A9F9A7C|nr:TetR/AcrR family transcriptional regulator [Actinocrispum wychmicini]
MGGEGRPRRSPAPEDRQADAERSRRQLLAAAFDEFASKGYAGARVHEIAARAGVNKQLINYYFGGKEGLYRHLQRQWLERESTFDDRSCPATEVITRYLHEVLADPRGTRLEIWRGLATACGGAGETPDEEPEQDLSGISDRQANGEFDPAIDPGSLLLMIMGAVTAPIVMPDMVQKIFGVTPWDPEFEERYSAHLRTVLGRLAPPGSSTVD